MAALIHAHDWAATCLGPIGSWPGSLRHAIGLMLQSPQAMYLTWGKDRIFFFNDAYRPILGARLPGALGRHFADLWGDVWPEFHPIVDRALAGESSQFADFPLTMTRNGYAELTWWSFSVSPLRDDDGVIAGLFCVTSETTQKVMAERRIAEEGERLRQMFKQAPGFVAILRGPAHVFELANDAYYDLVGPRSLTGLPVGDALPEVLEQGIVTLLDGVRNTGQPYLGREMRVVLKRANDLAEERFVDFIFQPILENGTVSGIFVQGHDVTEHKRMREEIDLARKTAERADRAKSQFLAAASHDLRQPFQAMRLYHEVLRSTPLQGNALTAADGLSRAMESGEELLHALLDVSALDAGQVTPKRTIFGIGELIGEIGAEYAQLAARKGLKLRVFTIDRLVCSDRVLLKRMLRNLMDNAMRYTTTGGVLLGGRRRGDELHLQVIDTGIGIVEEHLEEVYEEFFQVGNRERNRSGGLGLGLAIMRKMAQILGHRVTITSRPGKGSIFGICIPLAEDQGPPTQA